MVLSGTESLVIPSNTPPQVAATERNKRLPVSASQDTYSHSQLWISLIIAQVACWHRNAVGGAVEMNGSTAPFPKAAESNVIVLATSQLLIPGDHDPWTAFRPSTPAATFVAPDVSVDIDVNT
jgi:hypothetical protein